MRKTLLTGLFITAASVAIAAGNHDGGHGHGHGNHDDHHAHGEKGSFAVGKVGKEKAVTRTINITMLETDDGQMLFEPNGFKVAANETVRLSFTNKGEIDHEFVMDDQHGIEEHRKEMLAALENGNHSHHDHHGMNAISLKPGQTGEIIWQFSNSGKFQFACLIPGHFELGMHGILTVE